MNNKNINQRSISFNDIFSQYSKAKRNIGICLDHSFKCYFVKGTSSLELINHFSRSKVNASSEYGYIILESKVKLIGEALYFPSLPLTTSKILVKLCTYIFTKNLIKTPIFA